MPLEIWIYLILDKGISLLLIIGAFTFLDGFAPWLSVIWVALKEISISYVAMARAKIERAAAEEIIQQLEDLEQKYPEVVQIKIEDNRKDK